MKDDAKRKGPKPGAVAAFLALLPAIAEGLQSGHRLTALYQQHKHALGVSYSQFARYVARHITEKEERPVRVKNTKAAAGITRSDETDPSSRPTREPRRANLRELPTFHYDPMDAYQRKD